MKKTYVTPEIEKINFQYRDQVVAASGGTRCHIDWTGFGSNDVAGCNSTGNYVGETSPFA